MLIDADPHMGAPDVEQPLSGADLDAVTGAMARRFGVKHE